MEWLTLAGAWAGVAAAIGFFGEKLDDWWDKDAKRRLGEWLHQKVERDPATWLRGTNQAFLSLFDRAYAGKSTKQERAIWLAALMSLGLMVPTLGLAHAFYPASRSRAGSNFELGLLLGMVFMLSIMNLEPRARVLFTPAGPIPADRKVLLSEASRIGLWFWVSIGVIVGTVSAIAQAIFGGTTLLIVSSFGFGSVPLVVLGVFFRFVTIPIHPLKAMFFSLFAICLVGLLQPAAGSAFLKATQANPGVLALVAFNLFADAFSLLETRWVLQRSANAGVLGLSGWLVLDLVASAGIFLFLPTVLWPRVLSFWDAALFRGEQPWLGLFFWSTFATSALFYLFVLAALLMRPLAAAARGFGWLSRPFDLEKHPVRCIAIAMALVVTVGFIAGGVVQALVGSSVVTPPP